MQNPALTSVIIPVFQDQAGIERCLEALARQNYPSDRYEVIVVDNGSLPAVQIKGDFPFPLKLLRQTIPGSYAARNAGAAEARGDVLAFTDADCRPDQDWLYQGIRNLDAYPGDMIAGGDVLIDLPAKPTATALYQHATGFGQESNIRDKGFSATANLFCLRSQFESVGPFDTRLLSGGDREWCWRARKHGFFMQFVPLAIVHTAPRNDLPSALRQARRVVAGRKMLRELGLAHAGTQSVEKLRTPWESVRWILANPELRPWDRVRVLCVATVIRTAAAWERLRLYLGTAAERR